MSSSYNSLDWVLSHWAHFTCVDLFVFICVYFVCFCFILHSCCIIASTVGWTWWNWSLILGNLLSSVLWRCWLGHLTRKPVPDMTYNVFHGTLSLIEPWSHGSEFAVRNSAVQRTSDDDGQKWAMPVCQQLALFRSREQTRTYTYATRSIIGHFTEHLSFTAYRQLHRRPAGVQRPVSSLIVSYEKRNEKKRLHQNHWIILYLFISSFIRTIPFRVKLDKCFNLSLQSHV